MKRLILFMIALFAVSAPLSAQLSAVDFDAKMQEYKLVDIQTLEGAEDIIVELKYSTTDNFVGKDMYGDLEKAYFTPDFARKVVRAQQILRERYPQYTLMIYDAARPISVQRYMRKLVEGTPQQSFVADGSKGGRHNYGVAVDLTIATLQGEPLDMGAGFDDFTDKAAVKGTSDTGDNANRNIKVYSAYVNNLAKSGAISVEAAKNRLILIEVMLEAGLYPYRREWWHFEELNTIAEVRQQRRLLNF